MARDRSDDTSTEKLKEMREQIESLRRRMSDAPSGSSNRDLIERMLREAEATKRDYEEGFSGKLG